MPILCMVSFVSLPFLRSPHQPVPSHRVAALGQPPLPALASADGGRVVEQVAVFFLRNQSGDPTRRPPAGMESRFLAVG